MKTSVTQEDVDNSIEKVEYQKLGRKMTVALVTMTNGHEIVGKAGCVDPDNYKQEIGEKIALEDAKDQIWPLLGFNLQQKLYDCGVTNDECCDPA